MEIQDCNSSDIRPEAEIGSANASNNFSTDLIKDFNDVPSNQGDFEQSIIDPGARPFKKIRCKKHHANIELAQRKLALQPRFRVDGSKLMMKAALERELWSSATINEEVLKTINVIFSNFHKLHTSKAATLCIPHLVNALKSGSEAAKESVLDTLNLLKNSWSTMPIEVTKSQAMVVAEAIPILQMLVT
ncbi:hypothetical protein Ancab_003208 [Ancistrocladus abbreviatus]